MDDEAAMRVALEEAALAAEHGDVPIGAVALVDGEVVARRHNERELAGDPTAHAEVLCLRDASAVRGGWRLDGVTLVVSLEPCPMCAGALWAARVDRLVYGAADLRAGATGADASLPSPAEGCQSGRMGRPRKPLWPPVHRGFESLTLRQPRVPCLGS